MKAKGVLLEYHLGPGIVKLQLMSDYRQEFNAHWMKNKTAVQEFEFARWYKKKTTGKNSQNSHCWGHAQTIANEIGEDPREVVREACLRTPEYPSSMNKLGKISPKPWSQATTKEAGPVIETLHRIAAFLDIKLIENEWGKE
jgi:hypothetical protein